ncbi:hypothetical protein F5148DRAFT_1285326 [Russula earlei]|uniref:Uncharacterized protein n=1 Tax=Russula earlei TaxID=71964 RepID=A0ACC0U779_9AGAM|nr:hypothetical protein F5148DRAFT_1285326 [Russula earlei]
MPLVFDQHRQTDNGIVTGRVGKLSCIHNLQLSQETIGSLVKTPCGEIIQDLRNLYRSFYNGFNSDPPVVSDTSKPPGPNKPDPSKVSSHKSILDIIDRHMTSQSQWDKDDNGSQDTSVFGPYLMASRTHRKRKAPDSERSSKTTCKGRLLPPSSVNSKQSHSLGLPFSTSSSSVHLSSNVSSPSCK